MLPQIGTFKIERELGRGGMGVVYLARDTRLDREVAIKALPADFAGDAGRLARFQREAKVLASLNHPGVASIYGLEQVGSEHYLVLEYVEGESLATRLARGPLPIDEALEIAKQIAEAVEAAHEKGIVHRDLKPGNVMLRADGAVKVLDFGLARTGDDSQSPSRSVFHPDSPTVTSPAMPVNSPTIAGAILGTAGYMSPEQARGKTVDKRSDIFSFGCVLFEMLTGAQPFRGETVTDSLGATLHRDVEWALLPPGTPASVQRLLRRCLAKDKMQRLHDIGDARLELAEAISGANEPTSAAVIPSARGARRILVPLSMLALGVAGALFAVRALSPRETAESAVFASIDPAPGTTIAASGDVAGPAVISPDGRLIAFTGTDKDRLKTLWLRALDRAQPESLRGTENALFPFWSADGRSIGFFADGKLRRIDLGTRATRTICDAPAGRGGAWLESDEILFAPTFQSGVFLVPAGGGEPRPVIAVDKTRFSSNRWPSAVRGTDRFLYLAVNHDPARHEEISVFIASLDGAFNKEVINTPFGAQVVGDRLLFLRESTLLSASIDVAAGVLRGEPVPLLTDVSGEPSTWHPRFSASETGTLIYQPTPPPEVDTPQTVPQPGLGEAVRATIVDRTGRPAVIVVDGMLQSSLAASPDGFSFAISGRWPNETGAASYDIWVFTLFGPGTDWEKKAFDPMVPAAPPRRFTFMPGDEVSPQWSPDGKSIAFGKVYGPEPLGLFVKPLDGGSERLVLRFGPSDPTVVPTGWSRDGRYIICYKGPFIGGGGGDIVAVPAEGGEPIDLIAGAGKEQAGVVSNDNKWLAFDSWETGVPEVYATPFAPGWEADRAAGKPVPEASERYRISIAGGASPVWGTTGHTLFYASSSNSIIGVRWSTEGTKLTFDAGQPLFDFPMEAGASFDVLPTDEFFIVNASLAPRDGGLRIVLNWASLHAK